MNNISPPVELASKYTRQNPIISLGPTLPSADLSPDAVRGLPIPKGPGGNGVIWTVFLGLLSLVVMLSVLTFDIVVEAPGRISSDQDAVQLQPFDRALVRNILVTPGQSVEEGQVLVEFDPAQTELARRRASQQIASLEAEKQRLSADLANGQMRPNDGLAWQQQAQLLAVQRREREQRRRAFDNQERRARDGYASANQQLAVLAGRQQSADGALRRQEALSRQGHAALMQVDSARQQSSRIEQERLEQEQRRRTAENDLQTAVTERERWEADWQVTASSRLTEVERLLIDVQRELEEADFRARHNLLRAPFSATILDIADRSASSVASAGEVILRLTRAGTPIHVVADVEPRHAVWVKPDLKARIEFVGLPSQRHGHFSGQVRALSPNSVERAIPGQAGAARGSRVHRAYLTIERGQLAGLRNVPVGFNLSPGQEIIVRLKVGERAPIWYLLESVWGPGSRVFSGP